MSRRSSLEAKVSPAPSEYSNENSEKKGSSTAFAAADFPVPEEKPEAGGLSGNGLSPRKLGLRDGINIIVSLMIGSGIFCFASQVDLNVGGAAVAMGIWLISGLLTLTGALCYAELGTMIPGSGGEAQYLTKGFGSLVTYLFDWTNILIIKPISVSILMKGCVVYAIKLVSYLGWIPVGIDENYYLVTAATSFGSFLVAFLASKTPVFSQSLLNVLTWSKLMALASIIMGGFMYFAFSSSSPLVATFQAKNELLSGASFLKIVGTTAAAMNSGLWSFDGWNNLNMVAGDLKNPKRNLPLSIWISVSAVLMLYSVTMIAYYCVIPREEFIESKTVGTLFGEILSEKVFGDAKWKWIGSSIIALFVMGSTFSAALSSMITSSEVIILSAENGNAPAILSRFHSKWKTPANAYALQGLLAIVWAILCNDNMLTVYTFPVWIFYALCAAVVLIMRLKAPQLERPYRVFITTPILFLMACAVLAVSTAFEEPWHVLGSAVVVLTGVPVYYATTFFRSK